jgi:hypothetical protein
MTKRKPRVPDDHIELEDANGNRVIVPVAHYNRWPSVRENFRPVAENKGATAPAEPPTGDKTKEN